jgi:hypothetical protein
MRIMLCDEAAGPRYTNPEQRSAYIYEVRRMEV